MKIKEGLLGIWKKERGRIESSKKRAREKANMIKIYHMYI